MTTTSEEIQGKKQEGEITADQCGRFDYIRFDEARAEKCKQFYVAFNDLEQAIEGHIKVGRSKALALTKLEECYMWIGKAIRDEQVEDEKISVNVPERG